MDRHPNRSTILISEERQQRLAHHVLPLGCQVQLIVMLARGLLRTADMPVVDKDVYVEGGSCFRDRNQPGDVGNRNDFLLFGSDNQLVMATEEPKHLSVVEISYRISMPKTTTFRYVQILESKGYILQSPSRTDQFDAQLQLTKHAQSIMRVTLRALNTLLNGDQNNQSS